MAENVNAVAAFYADGTYALCSWDTVQDIQSTKKYVMVAVYHVQAPGLPNVIQVVGHDVVCLRRLRTARDGLVVRQIDNILVGQPGGGIEEAKEHFFERGSQLQETGLVLPNPATLATGGMDVVLYTLAYDDPAYNDLNTRALSKSVELRAAPVPSSGTY